MQRTLMNSDNSFISRFSPTEKRDIVSKCIDLKKPGKAEKRRKTTKHLIEADTNKSSKKKKRAICWMETVFYLFIYTFRCFLVLFHTKSTNQGFYTFDLIWIYCIFPILIVCPDIKTQETKAEPIGFYSFTPLWRD